MNTIERLNEYVKAALRQHNEKEKSVLRMVLAEMKNFQKDKNKNQPPSEEQAQQVLIAYRARLQKNVEAYKAAGAEDRSKAEAEEIAIVERYLPERFSPEKTREFVLAAVKNAGAVSAKEMGKVMKELAQYKGSMDMGQVSAMLKEILE